MKKYRYPAYFIIGLLLFSACKKDDNGNAKNEPYDKPVYAIAIQDETVWVGTWGNGLYRLEGEQWTNYRVADGLINDNIEALAVDQAGRLWAGTSTGLCKLENGTWTSYTTDDGLLSVNVKCLYCDPDGNVWAGTGKNGLSKYNGTGFTTLQVNPEQCHNMGHIHAITVDADGNIWAGSCITGLSVFDGENWTHEVNGLTVFVNACLCAANGDVWIAHCNGVDKYSDGVWTRYTVASGLADNCTLCLAADPQQNVFIGTENGLSGFDGNLWITLTTEHGLSDNYVSAIACDQHQGIWVGSTEGLVYLGPSD